MHTKEGNNRIVVVEAQKINWSHLLMNDTPTTMTVSFSCSSPL